MKKVLTIAGAVVVGIIILSCVIIGVVKTTSKKMVCTSNKGKITIMYNEDTIKGYTANGVEYDLDGQKSYAEKIGVESYLQEFETFWATNTDGSCKR